MSFFFLYFQTQPLHEAVGYTADLYRVEPIWKGKNLPKTLIIKVGRKR